MNIEVLEGIMIPLLGTTLGSGCVFFMRKQLSHKVNKALAGFAGGVMVAASIWSLIIPAMELSADWGKLAFIPTVIGFWTGIIFLLFLDDFIPHIHPGSGEQEGPKSNLNKTTMLVLAVVLHNIPEGMAVGVLYAGVITGQENISVAAALILSIGIALQNFPEGAIISMPLRGYGMKKSKAFLYGALSGVVEPIASVITIIFAGMVVPAMPYLLSFAAGAMIYVVVEELVPEMSEGEHSNVGAIMFATGFTLMMALDVALG